MSKDMDVKKELELFYKRFRINPKVFFSRFNDSFVTEGRSQEENILLSKLQDFKYLSNNVNYLMNELETIQDLILVNYQIEIRNTLDPEMNWRYVILLMTIEDFIEKVESDQTFLYGKRIQEIKGKLKNLYDCE